MHKHHLCCKVLHSWPPNERTNEPPTHQADTLGSLRAAMHFGSTDFHGPHARFCVDTMCLRHHLLFSLTLFRFCSTPIPAWTRKDVEYPDGLLAPNFKKYVSRSPCIILPISHCNGQPLFKMECTAELVRPPIAARVT